jgi:branched-chain amino acid aminotransferase
MEISGIYETMRSFNGKFALLPEHQRRIEFSCGEIGVAAPDLGEVVKEFEGREDVRLRIAVGLDGAVKVESFELPEWHGSFLYDEEWPVKVFDGARENAGVKSTDTEMQAKAREEAAREGFGEILLVDEKGRICEGGITNVFFVDGEKLVTPSEGMLPGISREMVLRACGELGIEVELRDVFEKELEGFDAVFLTNSIRGMVSTGTVLPVMEQVAEWCTRFIKGRA